MVLPGKHLPLRNSMIGLAALILEVLTKPEKPYDLWKRMGKPANWNWFAEAITFGYMLDVLDVNEHGAVYRKVKSSA